MSITPSPLRTMVYDEPGRFAGWPANYGMWAFGDEVVLVFLVGHVGPLRGLHARDTSRTFEPVLARSHDGGVTWQVEAFTGVTPGSATLSGDEHQDAELRARPSITDADFVPLGAPVDFTDPETITMCARTGLDEGSVSWFYVSRDRGHHWFGPHALPDFGLPGLSARTDVVPLGRHEALFMLTVAKSNGREGRVLAAHTVDGGRTFSQRGWLGPEPEGSQIMSSSLRLNCGRILASVRCHSPVEASMCWIDLYRSDDDGIRWEHHARPVEDTGSFGNPPVLLDLDGSLLCVYGHRNHPCGLRFVASTDGGENWSSPVIVTDDSGMKDMGYPRALVLEDRAVLACFYNNRGDQSERFIEAVRFRPWPSPTR